QSECLLPSSSSRERNIFTIIENYIQLPDVAVIRKFQTFYLGSEKHHIHMARYVEKAQGTPNGIT
ncbi:hypothetical protein CHS0354_029972, partial [Potamilus streckersoni]